MAELAILSTLVVVVVVVFGELVISIGLTPRLSRIE